MRKNSFRSQLKEAERRRSRIRKEQDGEGAADEVGVDGVAPGAGSGGADAGPSSAPADKPKISSVMEIPEAAALDSR